MRTHPCGGVRSQHVRDYASELDGDREIMGTGNCHESRLRLVFPTGAAHHRLLEEQRGPGKRPSWW